MIKRLLIISAGASLVAPASAVAHGVAASRYLETAKPYAPYEFLIGDWYSKVEGITVHQQFGWGPGKAYLTYSTFMVLPGKPEMLHFGGMMVWNGKSKALDFLFTLQPPTGAEEKGTMSVEPDGSVVRESEMTDSSGKTERLRQTFRKADSGTVVTSMAEETARGWKVNPPGDIVMRRQTQTADAPR